MRRRVAAQASRRIEGSAPWFARQQRLSVASSHHPLEREAERVSEAVASGRRVDLGKSVSQPHGATPGSAALMPHAEAAIASQTRRGEPLKPAPRRYFERRLGTGFEGVRIHADSAANQLASSLRAQAFTFGDHVFLGPGQEGCNSVKANRRLLAHELAHVAQQRTPGSSQAAAGGVVFRKEAAPLELDKGEVGVRFSIGISESPQAGVEEKGQKNGVVDLTDRELFPGDAFLVFARDQSGGRFNWSMPSEFETIEPYRKSGMRMRVGESLQLAGQEKVVEATLESALTKDQLRVRFRIAPPPEAADVVDPELAANEEAQEQLAAKRTRKREDYRATRQARRKKFRSGTREERRAGRSQYRQERKQARVARGKERRSLRRRAAKLRKQQRGLKRKQSCRLETQKEIQKAIEQGIQTAEAAINKLKNGGVEDPQVAQSLRYMRWQPDPSDAGNQARLDGIVDVLTSAKNSMLSSKDSVFQCSGSGCDENTGAFVKGGSQRGDQVFICTQWLRGTFKSPVATGRDEGRAYALLHEFVHLAGPQGSPEKYIHSGWESLTYRQAIQQADGYAALAWTLK